jgi:uncharacterized membrane protein YfcA
MEMFTLDHLLLFLTVGFAGFVDSMAGGGGLITVPAYMVFGVSPELILGTNKCVSTTGSTIAIARYLKNKAINLKLMIYGVVAGVIGSTVGAYLSSYLDSKKMVYLLMIVVPIILGLSFYRSKLKDENRPPLLRSQLITRCIFIGFIIGGYDGFFGPGTGTFLIISMIFFMNMTILEASANARVINYTSNLSAFAVFLIRGTIDWQVAGIALCGSIIGNYLGSGYVLKGNTKVVQVVFNLVLVSLLAKSIYDGFFA